MQKYARQKSLIVLLSKKSVN